MSAALDVKLLRESPLRAGVARYLVWGFGQELTPIPLCPSRCDARTAPSVTTGGRVYDRMVGSPRVILITGCSSPRGIGFATARRLAQDRHSVHATVRDHANDPSLRDGFRVSVALPR